MNFLKSLLLFFLFFGLGNFKAQEENNIKSVFISKNILLLESNYRLNSKKINFDIANIRNLRKIYDEKLKLLFPNKLIEDDKIKAAIYFYYQYYPDINAILLNRNNQFLTKITDEEKQKYNELFLEIAKQIPNETYIELSKITDEINCDKFALTVPYRFEIFQDLFDENQRKRIDIINFLLWNIN